MTHSIDLSGRVVLVTGAAAGLGRAYALWFGAHGAKVIANNRVHAGRPGGAAEVVAEIIAAGGTALADGNDIVDPAGGEAMVDSALSAFGRIDVVVSNAAVSNRKPIAQTSMADLREGMEVNFFGAIAPVMAALPHMIAQDYGRIVLTTSAAALFTQREHANYAAAKMAVVGFARTLAFDLAKTGIKVNVVSPYARTNMSRRALGETTEDTMSAGKVAPVVGWLSSEQCHVSGQIIAAGGGRMRRNTIVEGPVTQIEGEDVAGAWERIAQLSSVIESRNSGQSSLALVPELKELLGGS
jgi:NAD(P)-dependent dehydrogenase (short-subunit alcohol dehydrogenase family)